MLQTIPSVFKQNLYLAVIFYFLAALNCSLLGFNAFIASLLCQKGMQGIKSKAVAIKCCKEMQITAPPNEWHNIPLRIIRQRSTLNIKKTLQKGSSQIFTVRQKSFKYVKKERKKERKIGTKTNIHLNLVFLYSAMTIKI